MQSIKKNKWIVDSRHQYSVSKWKWICYCLNVMLKKNFCEYISEYIDISKFSRVCNSRNGFCWPSCAMLFCTIGRWCIHPYQRKRLLSNLLVLHQADVDILPGLVACVCVSYKQLFSGRFETCGSFNVLPSVSICY